MQASLSSDVRRVRRASEFFGRTASAAAEAGGSRLSLGAWLIACTSVLCLSLMAFGISGGIFTYGNAVGEAQKNANNLTQSLAQQASDTFEALDGVLLGLAGRVEVEGTGPAARQQLSESMAALVTAMPRLHDLFILDARGRLVVSNGSAQLRPDLRFDAQPYFRYHRRHANPGLHIGAPQLSPTENLWVLPVTRRITRADGGFGGVAVAQIALSYFEQIYEQIDVGADGAITLAMDDQTIVVRKPHGMAGRKIGTFAVFSGPLRYESAGSYVKKSSIDGIVKLTAFRRLGRYPLIVLVSLAQHEYLAQWRRHAIPMGIMLSVIVLMTVTLAFVVSAQIARRRRTEDDMAALALIDGLTGLANRRQFDLVLERECRRAARDRAPLGLLMIDVDDFKAFNDLYGHLAGDDALSAIARTIAGGIARGSDLAARYGGEEFAVILPANDGPSAVVVAERVRQAVLALEVEHTGSAAGVATVSIGAASFKPVSFDRPIALVEAADAALYAAKRSGRNAIVLAAAFLAPASGPVPSAGAGRAGRR